MKQFLLATFLSLAFLASPAARAQSPLTSTATKEQIAERLGIRAGDSQENMGYQLCFHDTRKGFGYVRMEKVADLFAVLEEAGLNLERAFNTTECDLKKKRPIEFVFSFADSPYTQLQRAMIPALALHAKRTGKGDDWLIRILEIRDQDGKTRYADMEDYGRKTPGELERLERDYRQLLSTFSSHEIALFGKAGVDLDVDYFKNVYKVQDVENFLGACVTRFLSAKERAFWTERARLFARGEYQPRGMGNGMDLDYIQRCLKVPDMEAKMREVTPPFERHEQLVYTKRQVKTQLAIMKEVRDNQAKLCPAEVPAVKKMAYCSIDYGPVYAKLQKMADNDVSGLTLAELDRVK